MNQDIKNNTYRPLIVVILMILVTSVTISFSNYQVGQFSIESTISYFMAGFFITFSTFKFMDLKGFANGYKTYDLLAMRLPIYGYIYPFIELFFGLSMIVNPFSKIILISEIVIMTFSGLGVAIKLAKKEELTCACLGTFLKVPLTKVTLVEDLGMVLLAIIMLIN